MTRHNPLDAIQEKETRKPSWDSGPEELLELIADDAQWLELDEIQKRPAADRITDEQFIALIKAIPTITADEQSAVVHGNEARRFGKDDPWRLLLVRLRSGQATPDFLALVADLIEAHAFHRTKAAGRAALDPKAVRARMDRYKRVLKSNFPHMEGGTCRAKAIALIAHEVRGKNEQQKTAVVRVTNAIDRPATVPKDRGRIDAIVHRAKHANILPS